MHQNDTCYAGKTLPSTLLYPSFLSAHMKLAGSRAFMKGMIDNLSAEGLLTEIYSAMRAAAEEDAMLRLRAEARRAEAMAAQGVDIVPAPLAKQSLQSLPSLSYQIPDPVVPLAVEPLRSGATDRRTRQRLCFCEAMRGERCWKCTAEGLERAVMQAAEEELVRGQKYLVIAEGAQKAAEAFTAGMTMSVMGGDGSGATVPSNPAVVGNHTPGGFDDAYTTAPVTFFSTARAFFRRAR